MYNFKWPDVPAEITKKENKMKVSKKDTGIPTDAYKAFRMPMEKQRMINTARMPSRALICSSLIICSTGMALGTFILMMVNMNAFPYIYHNGSGGGYEEEGDNSIATTHISFINTYECINTIDNFIIIGAGYYLKGNSHIQKFLNLVETHDLKYIDYNEVNQLVNIALENISLARETYYSLIKLAEMTPYKQEIILKLKGFDYESFMVNMELNVVVFNKLRGYLERGDITGTFKHTYSSQGVIEDLLKEIKNGIEFNRIPELSLLWKLNESCAESSLFGSYAARIFHAIK